MSSSNSYYSKSSTFVRYLFDGQLFNVPNNYQQYSYLITYLKHERIFGESYLVTVRDSKPTRSLRRHAADEDNPFGPKRKRFYAEDEPQDETRSRRWQNCRDDSERCNMMLNRAAVATTGDDEAFRFSGYPIRQPADQIDVRDLMTSVELSGGPTEWLDLKLTLRLPSIIVYLKLQGSNTLMPNADYTCRVTMQNLQALQGPRTIGEKLAMVLASIRKKFFNEPLPDFKRLTILQESGAYDLSDLDDDDDDNHNDDHDNHDNRNEHNVANTATLTRPVYDDGFPLFQHHEARERQESEQREELLRQRNRMAFGGGTVQRVLVLSDRLQDGI